MSKRWYFVGAVALTVIFLSACSSPQEETKSPGQIIGSTAAKTAESIVSESPAPVIELKKSPGSFCATNRLGKRFKEKGVVYECKGPKPYKWRRIS